MIGQTHKLYQKNEMLAYAKKCGFTISVETFDDWVERGLIGEAEVRVWPGQGSGSQAWWPQVQLDLFLDLLAFRHDPSIKASIMQLCHLPVWRWLYWGELGGVTLKQVKCAIFTWIDFQQKLSKNRIRKDITHSLRLYEGPLAAGKLPLIDELTQIMTFQKHVDRDVLQHYLDPVINGYPMRAPKGPVRASLDMAECWSLMFSLCWDIVGNKDRLECLPDAFWEWARFMVLIGPALMEQDRLAFANDPVWGKSFTRQTVHSLCFQSCHGLLTWLGLATQQEMAPWRTPSGRFLDPEAWQQKEVSWTHSTEIRFSPLLLPGGKPIPYLCNTITITYQDIRQPFTVALQFV